jgi:hypothetical protein
MSEHDEEQVGAEEAPSRNGTSMMDSLRRKHQELTEGVTIDIPIPGYNGALVARYRVLDVKEELGKINAKVRHEFRSLGEIALYATIDVLIAACEGMYYNDGDKLRPLSESFGDDVPVRYDDRLAEFLALDLSEASGSYARETVRQTFGENEPALIEHGRQLNVWMTDTSRSATGDFLAQI